MNTVAILLGSSNNENDEDDIEDFVKNGCSESIVTESGLIREMETDKSLFSQMLFSDDQSLNPCNENAVARKEKTEKESVTEIPLLIKVRFMLNCLRMVWLLNEYQFLEFLHSRREIEVNFVCRC